MEIILKMSLRDFFRAAPGDYCPDKDCGGFFDRVECVWSGAGISLNGVCDSCKQTWCIYEDFDFEKSVRMETQAFGSKPSDE